MKTTPPEESTDHVDRKLMEDLQHRQPEALNCLYCRYRTMLKSIVLRVLHDNTEADDVLQDIFLQVWDRAASYSAAKGKVVSWLCTLARCRAIDRLRQHNAYRRATDRYEVSCKHPDKEVGEIHTVERDVCRDDLRSLLHRHLTALPPPQEQAVRMAFLENRSQREISNLTKTPLGTVKTRIELGIKKLGNAMEGLREEMA